MHGNGAEATVTATLADDGVAPAPTTAEVGAGGLLVTLTFDEALDADSIPDPAAFTVSVQGTARTPAAAAVLDEPDALILTLPAPVRPGETVTVSYTGPEGAGGRPLQDGARNAVAAFAGVAAANGLPAAAPDAPENLQAAETGAGGAVTLSWRTPWHNGSAITKYRLRWVEGTGAGGTWEDIPQSGPGGANAGRHTVTGLTNGTAYTFQVLAVNAEGEGEPATLNATPEDRTAPRVVRSYPVIGGNLLVLLFNEGLNTGSVRPKSAFMVTVGGEALALVGSNLTRFNGRYRALEFTLADSIRPGDTVTVTAATQKIHSDGTIRDIQIEIEGRIRPAETVTLSYDPPATDPPATDPLADAAGNPVAAFADLAVTNDLKAYRPDAPERFGTAGEEAQLSATESGVLLTWAVPWHNGSPITRYEFRRADGHAPAEGDYGSWTKVPDDMIDGGLAPDGTTYEWDVTGLTPGAPYTWQVRAVNGKGEGDPATFPYRAADDTAPALETAGVNDPANLVSLAFSEGLDTARLPDPSAFTLTVEGRGRAAADISSETGQTGRTAILLVAEPAIRPGETVSVTYTPPADRKKRLQDLSGNPAAGFTNHGVTNDIAATAPDAPGNLELEFRGAGASGVTAILTWETPWHNGSPIAEINYRYAEGDSVDDLSSWLDFDNNGPGATRLTVTGLSEGKTYTFQVSALNGNGNGAAATVTAEVMDTAPPVLVDAGVEPDSGTAVRLTFDEALAGSFLAGRAAFTVTVAAADAGTPGAAGTRRAVSDVELGSDPAQLVLILAAEDAIRPGETVTVAVGGPVAPDQQHQAYRARGAESAGPDLPGRAGVQTGWHDDARPRRRRRCAAIAVRAARSERRQAHRGLRYHQRSAGAGVHSLRPRRAGRGVAIQQRVPLAVLYDPVVGYPCSQDRNGRSRVRRHRRTVP